MVIGNFNFIGISLFPHEADPPLVVDPDAILSFSIAGKLLQPVSRRNPEILERFRRIKDNQSDLSCN